LNTIFGHGILKTEQNAVSGTYNISETLKVTIGSLIEEPLSINAIIDNIEQRKIESNSEEIVITGNVGRPIDNVELNKYMDLIKDVNDDFQFSNNEEYGLLEIETSGFIPGIYLTDASLSGVNSTADIITQIQGTPSETAENTKGELTVKLIGFNSSTTIPVSFTFTPKTNEIAGYYIGVGGTASFSEKVDGIYVKDTGENNWINPTNGGKIVWNDYNSNRQIQYELPWGETVTVQLKGKYTIEDPPGSNEGANGVIAYSNGESLLNGWNYIEENPFERWNTCPYSVL